MGGCGPHYQVYCLQVVGPTAVGDLQSGEGEGDGGLIIGSLRYFTIIVLLPLVLLSFFVPDVFALFFFFVSR